jgi:hypothetical protein
MDTRQYQGESAPFDNSREALAYIGAVYGAQTLLSEQVKTLLAEVAPHLPPLGRNVVHTVITAGALDILKAALDTSEGEQEKAYDQAVKSVVENFGMNRNLAEGVLSEFVDALGWEINAATPVTEVERLPRKLERHIVNYEKPKKTDERLLQQMESKTRSIFGVNIPINLNTQGDLQAGQRNVTFGKYKWRVLDEKDGKALLLSEDILEKRAYHHEYVDITWEHCDLRSYLNGEFLRTFKEEEQRQVTTVTNKNEDNQWYKIEGGNDTSDKIFLISLTEVVKYFGDSGKLQNPTKEEKDQWYFHDRYSDARKSKYGNEWSWWWLRSPGCLSNYAANVCDDGDLTMDGDCVHIDEGGVRPALWLNL